LIALVEQDHAKALSAATGLVRLIEPRIPVGLTRGAQLIGTVAAYAQVFEETKTQDAAAATAARKKALEGLIDAATDRHGRGGEWIFSVGSNVGIGAVHTYPLADKPMSLTDTDPNPNADSTSPNLRVPLSIGIDHLPGAGSFWHVSTWSWHFAATIGDLGQFAAAGKSGKLQPVRWDNFLSPGIEVGIDIPWLSSPERAVNLTGHIEYAPALFDSDTGSGAWRVGVALGFYVPFFDFN
jgi:hypothetical protein